MNTVLSDREFNAVLAGLRLLQASMTWPDAIKNVASDEGTVSTISDVELDELCERLNTNHSADLGHRCTNCQSKRVQVQCWVDANKLVPVESSSDDIYCPDCDEHDKRFDVVAV